MTGFLSQETLFFNKVSYVWIVLFDLWYGNAHYRHIARCKKIGHLS